ncbi:exosortase B [Paucibacter sp. APW11]|uniref:Exosortase B n=1 Tax=Roseateles aquae TaxID=3077235 RepID=A0ABU3PFH9_9BURK|nr:exosortase B [Paucibacter sp. APW11]MDT9001324.1 exosortase B [Paucibacter sp. APW11]
MATKPAAGAAATAVVAPRRPVIPPSVDLPSLLMVVAAFALLYLPAYYSLSQQVWSTDEQGHGPIILAVAGWLLYQLRYRLVELQSRAAPVLGYTLLAFAALVYVVGRSQAVLIFEVGSQILVLAALLLIFRGWAGLRAAWFPLFFLFFMLPLPEALVASVTSPLKSAVSAVASNLLYALGYPVGRAGVMLTVGQYQLLVADACAGLNSMFTLEALGMLYMNLMAYTSVARNVTLAILLIPIAFVANVTRVMILVLVTYYFGDEAGQGFVHGFAGMVLFMVALSVMLVVDKLLGFFFKTKNQEAA